jgi:hypothetical protein
MGRADVPSGRSRGAYEAFEPRDGGSRCAGKGVLSAVRNVNEIIAAKLKGMDVRNQTEIDSTMIELDGTNIPCPRSDGQPPSILGGLVRLSDLLCDLLGVYMRSQRICYSDSSTISGFIIRRMSCVSTLSNRLTFPPPPTTRASFRASRSMNTRIGFL